MNRKCPGAEKPSSFRCAAQRKDGNLAGAQVAANGWEKMGAISAMLISGTFWNELSERCHRASFRRLEERPSRLRRCRQAAVCKGLGALGSVSGFGFYRANWRMRTFTVNTVRSVLNCDVAGTSWTAACCRGLFTMARKKERMRRLACSSWTLQRVMRRLEICIQQFLNTFADAAAHEVDVRYTQQRTALLCFNRVRICRLRAT